MFAASPGQETNKFLTVYFISYLQDERSFFYLHQADWDSKIGVRDNAVSINYVLRIILQVPYDVFRNQKPTVSKRNSVCGTGSVIQVDRRGVDRENRITINRKNSNRHDTSKNRDLKTIAVLLANVMSYLCNYYGRNTYRALRQKNLFFITFSLQKFKRRHKISFLTIRCK